MGPGSPSFAWADGDNGSKLAHESQPGLALQSAVLLTGNEPPALLPLI